MADPTQLHAVILDPGVSKDQARARVTEVGGFQASDLGQAGSLLAELTLQQAVELSEAPGIRLVAPVGMNHQVKRLRVQLGADGNPKWRYTVRDNDIVRIAVDSATTPTD